MLLNANIAQNITRQYSEKTDDLKRTFAQAYTNYCSDVRAIWIANEAEAYLEKIKEILSDLFLNSYNFARATSDVVIEATNNYFTENERIGESLGNSESYTRAQSQFGADANIILEFAKKTFGLDDSIGLVEGQESALISVTETFLNAILTGVNNYKEIDVAGYLTGETMTSFENFVNEINSHLENFATEVKGELDKYLPQLSDSISKVVSNFADNIETARSNAAQAAVSAN